MTVEDSVGGCCVSPKALRSYSTDDSSFSLLPTGKTGRRTTRSKTATPKKSPKTKGVGDSDSKYAMTCSPCKRETFTRWVFGRDLVAYKAVAAAVTPAGDTIYVSLYDGTTCYRIGEEKLDSARGWFVYLDAEDAAVRASPSCLNYHPSETHSYYPSTRAHIFFIHAFLIRCSWPGTHCIVPD